MTNPALELLSAGVAGLAPGFQPSGELNDPVFHEPAQYGTPYFAYANAVLAHNTSGDLRRHHAETARLGLAASISHMFGEVDPDPAAADFTHAVGSPGFRNLRDFMWPPILRTFIMLRDLPDPGMDLDLAPMEELIRKVDSPNIFSEKPPVNWATVWMVGEWLRIREGLSPYSKADMDAWLAPFFEQNLEMNHGFNKELAESIGRPIDWTTAIDMEHGFFREPGVPNSYDMFSRVHLLELLVDGYDGAFAAQMHDLLATGMKRSLGVQLSSGSLASAYRSSAHLWNLTGQTYYFYHGSRLLADRNPDLSAKAEAACKRAFRACQTCQRESGDLSPVENVHPLGWRVGYEVYTMEAHYVAMPLGFLGAAIVDGFDGVGEATDEETLRVLIEPYPVDRHLVHGAGWSVHVTVSPFAGYDPLGIADITLGVGRRLRFGGQTHYGRGDAHPDAHKLSNQLPFTLGLALRDPDRSIHPVSALQPTGARGAEASADGLTAFAETERGRYSIRIAIAHNELKLVEELGDAARSLMVPYLRDRGDGCQTEVTRSGNGLRLQSGSEIIDIVVGDAIERMVHLPFGYESRHGLVGLARLDLSGTGPVHYQLVRVA